ncbi:MAG: terminase small subunit [Gallionellaceae bacterium]|nr:terminase small subunit [Gallionellaceae bacterium]
MNDRQRIFVAEYVRDQNATQAAIRAGYSPRTAYSIGERLLRNAQIRAAVDARLQEAAEKAGLSVELVLASIVRELSFDPADIFNVDGSIKPLHEMYPDTRKALNSVETVQVGSPDAPVFIRKVKWNQPNAAREQAMKHLGMFLQDNRQKPAEVIREIRLVALQPKGKEAE